MDRCPCCNARLRELSSCPRCKSDLLTIIHSEQRAKAWLSEAIQYWKKGDAKRSTWAVNTSLALKTIPLALTFRSFIIQQEIQEVLALLEKKQPLVARQVIYNIKSLLPYSPFLQKISEFTDYLCFESSPSSLNLNNQ